MHYIGLYNHKKFRNSSLNSISSRQARTIKMGFNNVSIGSLRTTQWRVEKINWNLSYQTKRTKYIMNQCFDN